MRPMLEQTSHLASTFDELLTAHDIPHRRDGDNLLLDNGMQFTAHLFEHTRKETFSLVQLDICLDGSALVGRTLIESGAGWGSTVGEAIEVAWKKFLGSSFHVLVESMGFAPTSEQTEWEDWSQFRACMGPLIRYSDTPSGLDFADVIDEVRARIDSLELSCEIHWLRIYFDSRWGEPTVEALLDNEEWTEGETILRMWAMAHEGQGFDVRHFLVLVPR